jgi:hypothetical protein
MSDKKKHDEHKHDEQEDRASHEGDLIEHDPEKAQNLVDAKEAAEHAGGVNRPDKQDPQRPDQGIPPGQENVPEGFTTGRGMQGGSANRRKR